MAGPTEHGLALRPFFSNQVTVMKHLMKECKKKTTEVEEVTWVEGRHIPADIGTRPGVALAEIGQGSTWQSGQFVHQLQREDRFLKHSVEVFLPGEEPQKLQDTSYFRIMAKCEQSAIRKVETLAWHVASGNSKMEPDTEAQLKYSTPVEERGPSVPGGTLNTGEGDAMFPGGTTTQSPGPGSRGLKNPNEAPKALSSLRRGIQDIVKHTHL